MASALAENQQLQKIEKISDARQREKWDAEEAHAAIDNEGGCVVQVE